MGQVRIPFPLAAGTHTNPIEPSIVRMRAVTPRISIAYRISVLEQREGLNWIAHPLVASLARAYRKPERDGYIAGWSVVGRNRLDPVPKSRSILRRCWDRAMPCESSKVFAPHTSEPDKTVPTYGMKRILALGSKGQAAHGIFIQRAISCIASI